MNSVNAIISALAVCFVGCGVHEIKPIDIFAEDVCSNCRMAISDDRFAGEIITVDREVFKFDDIGCMELFEERQHGMKIAARFVRTFESTAWIPYEKSIILETTVTTPMGSGKIAFADSTKAQAFARQRDDSATGTRMDGRSPEGHE